MKLLSLLIVLAFVVGALGEAPDGTHFDSRELARRGGKKRGGGKGRWPEGCDPSGLKDALKGAKSECQEACSESDGTDVDVDIDVTNDGNRMLKRKGGGDAKRGKGGEGKEYQECKKAVLSEIFSEVKETCRETCAEDDENNGDEDGEGDKENEGDGTGDGKEDDASDGSDDAKPRECMQKCLSEKCGLNKGKDRMLRRGSKGGSDKDRRPGGENGEDDSDRPNKRECVLKCAEFCGARKPNRPGNDRDGKGPDKAQRKTGGRGGKGTKKPSACLKDCLKANKPSKTDVEDAFNAADCVDPFACERTCVSGKREQWLSANGCAKPEDEE